MDEIKKINNNLSGQIQPQSSSNFTILKGKYSKFLAEMQKSETGNSVSRYEKELDFLNQLISEAEKEGDKSAVEEYEKKAQEIVDTISQMKIEILPAYTSPLLYRPAIYIEPDRNDGSKTEKIYALSKFVKVGDDGEEIPLFTNKEIKEFLKDEAIYDRVLALTTVTREDEEGFKYPFLSGNEIKKIACDKTKKLDETIISRMQGLAAEKGKKPFSDEEEFLFYKGEDIYSLSENDDIYNRTIYLMELKDIENFEEKKPRVFYSYEIGKFAQDTQKFERIKNLSELNKKYTKYSKYSEVLIPKKQILECLNNDEEYNEILEITATIKKDLEYIEQTRLKNILGDEKRRKMFLSILRMENQNGEKIFSNFIAIDSIINEVFRDSEYYFDDNARDTIQKISLLKNEDGKKLYEEEQLWNFLSLTKKYDADEIVEIAKLTHTNETGETTSLIMPEKLRLIKIDDVVIENAKKLLSLKEKTEDGKEKNIVPRKFINQILEERSTPLLDSDLNKIKEFLQIARNTYYTDLKGNTRRVIEEYDLIDVNHMWEWEPKKEKEDLELMGKLLNLTMEKDGIETKIFKREDILSNYTLYYIPEYKEINEHFFHNVKELAKINEKYGLGRKYYSYEVMTHNILELANEYNGKIDENFLKNLDEIMSLEKEGAKLLTAYGSVKAVMSGVTKETIEELEAIIVNTYSNSTQNTYEAQMFEENEIIEILERPENIKIIKELANITIDIEEGKTINLFQGEDIIGFLSSNPEFKKTEEFDANIDKIKNIIKKEDTDSNIGHKILQIAQDTNQTDKFVEVCKKIKNNFPLALNLMFEQDVEINEELIDRLNKLSEFYIKREYPSIFHGKKEIEPMFSISDIITYGKDENKFKNIVTFAKLLTNEKDSKIIIDEKLKRYFHKIGDSNLQINEAFITKFNEYTGIKIGDKPFLSKSLAVKAIFSNTPIEKLYNLAKYRKTNSNDKESLFSEDDLESLIEIGIKNTTDIVDMFSKNGLCAFDGFAIVECVKYLPLDLEERMKEIASKTIPNNLSACNLKIMKDLIEKINSDNYFKDILKSLECLNGDLELAYELHYHSFNEKEREKIIELNKYYSKNDITNNYNKIINRNYLKEILNDEERYAAVLEAANYKAEIIGKEKISKFNASNLSEIAKSPELIKIIKSELPNIIPSEKLEKYNGNNLINAAKLSFVYNKKNINELTLDEKRKLIKTLISTNVELFNNKELKADFPLIPSNQEEYCSILPKLVKSIGIETEPLDDNLRNKFLNEDLSALTNEIEKIDTNNLQIKQKITPANLIEQIKEAQITNNISDEEMRKVYDYFGFEIKNNELNGYPANINNGKKLAEIEDENTRSFINDVVRSIIIDFTRNNTLETNQNSSFTNVLNSILKAMPELQKTVTKPSIYEEKTTVLEHSIKILKEISTSNEFKKLTNEDKQILTIATLLHNISNDDIDSISKESAFDSFFICKKLKLPKKQETKLYDLIKNFNWNDAINNSENITKTIEDIAFNLRSTNSLSLATLFEKAKIKNTTVKKSELKRELARLEENKNKVNEYIKELQKTQPMLPNIQLPKSSEIKEGKGVEITADGVALIKLNEVENFEAIGFPEGTTKENVKFLVHALDYGTQLANFNTFSLIDSDALLSTSYIIDPYNEYRVFRPQGIILDTDTMDVHAGSNMDFGSGCKKNIETLKQEYIFGNKTRGNDRTFFSELVKVALGTTDEEKAELNKKFKEKPRNNQKILEKEAQKITDEKYIEIIEKYQNKSFSEIQKEDPEFANELIKIFDIIENCNRRNNRQYNEVLVTRPKIQGVFMFDAYQTFSNTTLIQGELYNYAKENDLPVIIFGDKDIKELKKYRKNEN